MRPTQAIYRSINTSTIPNIRTHHNHCNHCRYEIELLLPTHVAATPLKIPFASAVCFPRPLMISKKLSNRPAIIKFSPSKAWDGCRVSVVIQDTRSIKSSHYTICGDGGANGHCVRLFFLLSRVVLQCFVIRIRYS